MWREQLAKIAPWLSLLAILPLAIIATMQPSEAIADASYLLLFIPLLWACISSSSVGVLLMAVVVSFARLALQYIHWLSVGGLMWGEFLLAGLTPMLLYGALAASFLLYRYRQHRLRQRLLAKARLEAMGQLAGGFAHDINNACSVVLATAQLMRMNDTLGASLRTDLETIIDAASRGSGLVQHFVGLSHDAKAPLEIEDMNKVVDNSYRHIKPTLGPEVHLEIHPAPEPLPVRCSEMQMHQALLNLCMNAAEAMHNRGHIVVRLQRRDVEPEEAGKQEVVPGRYAEVEVTDVGGGMTAKTARRIFEPFFTTKDVERATGLGLVVVRDIVRRHAGFIAVRTRLGEGSTFSLLVPLAPEAAG